MKCIGVFDSGIGGASILIEMLKLMPNEKYLFLSDSANNPYGDKSKDKIHSICRKNIDYLLENGAKCIVIACNTASTQMAEILRKEYKDIPIFAIEPAYKMVYDHAYEKPTLVMATKGTIKSERFHYLFKKYNNHKTYIISCAGLADSIEEGNEKKISECLDKYLLEYKGKVENVVLGCTHYPFVEKEIKDRLGSHINFFYGAASLASHVKNELEKMDLLEKENTNKEIIFRDTSDSTYKKERFFEIINGGDYYVKS